MNMTLNRVFTALLTFLCIGCIRNTPGIPPQGIYFTFADKGRMARLEQNDLIAERVDLLDTTKVVYSQKLSNRFFVELHTSRTYSLIFSLAGPGGLFQVGNNKIRLRYEGLPGTTDWFEFYNGAQEWTDPEQVKFNGKSISRVGSSEPVDNSYLYVLK